MGRAAAILTSSCAVLGGKNENGRNELAVLLRIVSVRHMILTLLSHCLSLFFLNVII